MVYCVMYYKCRHGSLLEGQITFLVDDQSRTELSYRDPTTIDIRTALTCENTATFLHPEQLETIGRKSGWPVAMEVKTTLAEGWKEEEETITGEERIDGVCRCVPVSTSTAAVRLVVSCPPVRLVT